MNILTIILAGIILILLAAMAAYRRQIKKICRQLSFLRKHESNMLIGRDFEWGGIGMLADELNRLLEQQRKSRKKYLAQEKEVADTYTNLSHDIRTPLTSLDGYIQLLEQSREEAEQKRYLFIIRERVSSLKEMLEELFTFTRLKDSSYELELHDCPLNRILKETLFSYYEDWMHRGIEPVLEITEEALVIRGNAQALKRTIQNIIKNGMDHGEKKIHISLVREENQAVMTFTNTVSHPEEIDPARVFDRFYKGDPARSRQSTGLGLSIARGFTELMNGQIRASLQENGWFSIEIRFPLIEERNINYQKA